MPIRILALCGFTQNAHIYSKQLGAIRKTCKEVEFVFLEPPIVVEKADMPWNQGSLDEFDSTATTETEVQTPETTPRAWWTTTQDRSVYKKFDQTVSYLHEFLTNNEPFDGIMGFSQGACMAAVLAALLEKPGLHPLFPPKPQLARPKFVIAVGGFLPTPTLPSFEGYFPLPSHLPVLHVIGHNDVVVHKEKSQTLIAACENSRVEFHDGGHFTPSKASWRHFFNAYITSVSGGGSQADVPPVNSFGPSGANTPINARDGGATPRPASPAVGTLASVSVPTPPVSMPTPSRNSGTLHCPRTGCDSVILSPGVAERVDAVAGILPYNAASPFLKPTGATTEAYWLVKGSPFAFDNMGFSKPDDAASLPLTAPGAGTAVGKVKWLLCAECDLGPLGWSFEGGEEAWVAIDRIREE